MLKLRKRIAEREQIPVSTVSWEKDLAKIRDQLPDTDEKIIRLCKMKTRRAAEFAGEFAEVVREYKNNRAILPVAYEWTPAEDEKLYKAFMSGATENVLALQLGVPVQQIRERLKVVCSVPAQAAFQPAAVSVYDVPDDLPPYMPLEDEVLPSSGLKQIPHVWQPEEDKRIFQLSRRGVDDASIAQGIGCTAAEVEDRLSHLRWFAEHLYERE